MSVAKRKLKERSVVGAIDAEEKGKKRGVSQLLFTNIGDAAVDTLVCAEEIGCKSNKKPIFKCSKKAF